MHFSIKTVIRIISISISLLILIGVGYSQTLQQLITDNNQIHVLENFKDDENTLRLKLSNLAEINRSRRKEGLNSIQLDILACRVANMHCEDMIAHQYGGHWDSQGWKPYQRYALHGGKDHIGENVYIYQQFKVIRGKDFPIYIGQEKIPELMSKGHQTFMAETPPKDGHRREILNPDHTHVGIGYATGPAGFRYCQEFLDRYVDMDPFPSTISRGDKIDFTGKTLNSEYSAYGAVVYYDSYPKPYNPLNRQPSIYPDFGQELYEKIASWETLFDKRLRKFTVPVSFQNAKNGYYYVIIYVKKELQNLHLDTPRREEWNTKYGIPATSIVIEVK